MKKLTMAVLIASGVAMMGAAYANEPTPATMKEYHQVQVPVTKDGKIKATMYIKKDHAKEVHDKVVKSKSAQASFWGDVGDGLGGLGQGVLDGFGDGGG